MALPSPTNSPANPFAKMFEGGPFDMTKGFEFKSFDPSAFEMKSLDASAMMRVPVGAASPLWGLFMGAAATGAAFWWMSQWAKPQNLEAVFGKVALATAPPEPIRAEVAEADPAPAPVLLEAAEVMIETVTEATADVIEALAEPMLDAAPSLAEAVVEEVSEFVSAPLVVAEALTEALEDLAEPVLEAAPVVVESVAEVLSPEPAIEAAGEIADVTSAGVEEAPTVSDLVEPVADAAAEAAGDLVEATAASASEAPNDMATLADADMPEAPVGGESAPVSILAEAEKPSKPPKAPRPRKPPASPAKS